MNSTTNSPKSISLLKTEILISGILRFGVLLCGGIMLVGITLGLRQPDLSRGLSSQTLKPLLQGKMLENPEPPPSSLKTFSEGAKTGDAGVIMALGLLCLIALPVVR